MSHFCLSCPILPPNVLFLPLMSRRHCDIFATIAVSCALFSLFSTTPSFASTTSPRWPLYHHQGRINHHHRHTNHHQSRIDHHQSCINCYLNENTNTMADRWLKSKWSSSNFRMIMSCRVAKLMLCKLSLRHIWISQMAGCWDLESTRLVCCVTCCHNLDHLPMDRTWSWGPNKHLQK